VRYNHKRLGGMMYIGEKLSFPESRGIQIEVHIFDFNENIVGQVIGVEFVKYLRESQAFKDLNTLKSQLQEDERIARKLLLGKT
jgi:FAD synthase